MPDDRDDDEIRAWQESGQEREYLAHQALLECERKGVDERALQIIRYEMGIDPERQLDLF